MTSIQGGMRRLKAAWLTAWPIWAVLIFASLVGLHSMPVGFTRVATAAPILLIVPGSLTLGAVFGVRQRPQGAAFVCWAVVVSAIWLAFSSLALYALGVLITAASTSWCLFVVSAVLALVAEARLVFGRPGGGHSAARRIEASDPDGPDSEADDADAPAGGRQGFYSIVAIGTGVCLLSGGLYAYDRLPHPEPVGYTFMAWTSPRDATKFDVSDVGADLHFQIVHRESQTGNFRLTAAWLGSRPRSLANPLTFSIGPNKTFRGALFVPPLPNGCLYRIIVTLTAPREIDPQTHKPQTWSIDADVHDSGKPSKTCQ